MTYRESTLGARYLGTGRCHFRAWAPKAERVELHLLGDNDRFVPLKRAPRDYYEAVLDDIAPGTRYTYRLDGADEFPDPASRWQPEGVHGPSAVVDPGAFAWTDAGWFGVAQQQLVFYELHVGTFTQAGTFEGVIEQLPYLRDLGVTALEIMPVAQFPGARNWGYDGVFHYAPQNTYGGPEGLRRLVDAAHAHELAVFLDVVYNHFGPEGNYTGSYGYYTTSAYHSPWGDAINMDGPHSDEVRRFFLENALYWVSEFHVDGFRLDATDRIIDESAQHFLRELSADVHDLADRLGRRVWLVAESDANDVRWLLPPQLGGHGLDAQWGDDFHHALHALLTGEETGYYADFGTLNDMALAFRQNFVYTGAYSHNRRRRHGNSPALAAARQFVVCSQNHDQVGNRATGERLTALVPFEALKLAAGVVLLSPYLPLLFMGEEYGETAPFQYFTDHGDPALREAVSRGRREEFAHFNWQGEVPDPQDPTSFERSKLDHALRQHGQHAALLDWYRELLRLRRERPALADLDKRQLDVLPLPHERVLVARRWSGEDEVVLLFAFGDAEFTANVPLPAGRWRALLDADDERWAGGGSSAPEELCSEGEIELRLRPKACVVLERVAEGAR
jgi:maltooligosyltrehalose trehalohydrolase